MEQVVVLLPEDIESGALNCEDKFIWDRSQVLMLIKEYRNLENQFKDYTIKRKVLWRKIAQNLKKNGINVSWETCDKKWRNLKQTFKSISSSKRSEISKRKWEFYTELQDIFIHDINVKGPSYVYEEMPEDSVEVVEMTDIDSYISNERDGDSNSEQSMYAKIKTNCNSSNTNGNSDESDAPVWFQEFLSRFREDERIRTSMLKKMMGDVVRLEERKCELLEILVKKLGDNSSDLINRTSSERLS